MPDDCVVFIYHPSVPDRWPFFNCMDTAKLYVAGSDPIPYDMSFDADLAGIWASLPSILESPTDSVKFAGESAQLSAVVESPGPYSCQWFFNRLPLLDATNSVLLLDRVLQDQAGRYSLTASNVAGSVTSSSAMLVVMELPQLRMGLQGNELGLIVAACPRPCTVLVSTNLTTWTELLTLPSLLNATNVPIEWDSSSAANRYYRLRLGSEDSNR